MTWTEKETKLIDEEVSRKPMETTELRKDILLIGSQENAHPSVARTFEIWVIYHTDKILTLKERMVNLRDALNRYIDDNWTDNTELEFESISLEDLDGFPTSLNVKHIKDLLQYFLSPDYPGIPPDDYELLLAKKYGVTPPTDYNI